MSERFIRVESQQDILHTESDIPRDSIYNNKIPRKLIKTFIFSIIFVLIGIGLLIAGIIKATLTDNIQSSFPYWILSALCLIPGLYYLVQFIRAKLEKNLEYKREIFDDIPEL